MLSSVVSGKWLLDRILFTFQLSWNIKTFCYAAAHILISEKAKPNEAVGLDFMLVSSIGVFVNFPVIYKPFANSISREIKMKMNAITTYLWHAWG